MENIEPLEQLSKEELLMLFLTFSDNERKNIFSNLEKLIKALKNIQEKLQEQALNK